MVRMLYQKFDRDWGWNLGRLLAYSCLAGLFSVVGLDLILLVVVLHIFGGDTQQDIARLVARVLPDHVSTSAVDSFIATLLHTPWYIILLGLPLTLWWGTRFFVVMESCLCVIFRRPKRTFRRQNLAAFGMLLVFALTLPVIALSLTIAPNVAFSLLGGHHSLGPSGHLTSDPTFAMLFLLAGFVANVLLLLLAYTELTPGRVSLRAAWPGALLAALLSQGYMLIFPYYTRDVLHAGQYGSYAGFVVVVLAFFFAYSCFVIIGAEVAALRAGYAPMREDVTTLLAEVYEEEQATGQAYQPHVALPDMSEGRTPHAQVPPIPAAPPFLFPPSGAPAWTEAPHLTQDA